MKSVFIQAGNSRTHKITVYSKVSVKYAKKIPAILTKWYQEDLIKIR